MDQYSQIQGDDAPMKPNNFLPLAIVSTILGCCSPWFLGFIVGIVSIVFSSQVNSKYFRGDYEGAEKSAKTAKILTFVALGLVAIGLIRAFIVLSRLGVDGILEQYQGVYDALGM